ncbi:DarT ssDNA thymidine ADP-ribosyltransferase family protein [Mycobacterium sp. CnD-18-1]|uniref:DarT ssDNA thymidine ADP-ribosyltransferase family protein n=1 Tax=Mycobacterium TaxID=1763 RepID=UPI00096AB276
MLRRCSAAYSRGPTAHAESDARLTWYTSDGNAVATFTHSGNDIAEPASFVDFDLLCQRDWYNAADDANHKGRPTAEILIHAPLPIELHQPCAHLNRSNDDHSASTARPCRWLTRPCRPTGRCTTNRARGDSNNDQLRQRRSAPGRHRSADQHRQLCRCDGQGHRAAVQAPLPRHVRRIPEGMQAR